MNNFIRNLFKIRKQRKNFPISERPDIGKTIIRSGIKLVVSEPISNELWDWMLLVGWRVNNFKNDRRDYIELPEGTLRQLKEAGSDNRETVHRKLLRSINTH